MYTEIKNSITITHQEAQYDEKAKRLLGQKYILAYILINTVEEFQGMPLKQVVSCIEGEPMIGSVPVEPGVTNRVEDKQRIVGLNSENAEINEGLIRFDIIFYVRLKDGVSQMIVNIEAQKDEPKKYYLLDRAIFYVCRLISSQKERDFSHSNYHDLKHVFSIWICMNMEENCMEDFHLVGKKRLGNYHWNGRADLLNIVLIGLAKEPPAQKENQELHRLLGTLFSQKLSADQKLKIMESEYAIPLDDAMKEEVNEMCNLSQGIKEAGIAIGESRGIAIGESRGIAIGESRGKEMGAIIETNRIAFNMYQKGFTLEQIAIALDKDINEVRTMIDK